MSLSVPCPKCSKKLKLPGREALGKTAKCPACHHKFKLALPKAGKQPGNPAAPLGLEPKYVFETAAGGAPAPASAYEMPVFSGSDAEVPAFNFPTGDNVAPNFDAVPSDPISGGTSATPSTSVDPIAALRKRRAAKRKKTTAIAIAFVVLLVAGGTAAVMLAPPSQPVVVAVDPSVSANTAPVAAATRVTIESPTRGEMIPTNLLPAGVGILIHLRPAEIWSRNGSIEAALPPSLKPWLARSIQEQTDLAPEQIEELTVGIVLGARGVPPQTAMVVRTVEAKPLGEAIQEFSRSVSPTSTKSFDDMRLLTGAERAVFIKDERTFAIAPASLADDLPDSIKGQNPYLSQAISPLIEQTDRDRLVSFVIGSNDFDIHGANLVPQVFLELANGVLETFDWPTALVWSLHPGKNLYSEFVLQPRANGSPVAYEQTLLNTFQEAPQRLATKLRLQNPATEGVRDLVGRFPAMLEAVRLSSDVVADTRFGVVKARTLLPAVAGPNLVLGSVLTYNVFASAPAIVIASTTKAPEETDTRSLAERLQTVVDGEFTRVPLQEALAYLADEAKIALIVDGDALKLAGYTKNMAQSFQMGRVSVQEALRQIVAQYDKMVVARDDNANQITVLTRAVAEERGLKLIDF